MISNLILIHLRSLLYSNQVFFDNSGYKKFLLIYIVQFVYSVRVQANELHTDLHSTVIYVLRYCFRVY
jgi:hypothetical protein